MKTKIGGYDAQTGQVAVTFDHAGVKHQRGVNACHDEAGAYDKAATAKRVAEVALGVAQKIEMGVIGNALSAPPPPETPEA